MALFQQFQRRAGKVLQGPLRARLPAELQQRAVPSNPRTPNSTLKRRGTPRRHPSTLLRRPPLADPAGTHSSACVSYPSPALPPPSFSTHANFLRGHSLAGHHVLVAGCLHFFPA